MLRSGVQIPEVAITIMITNRALIIGIIFCVLIGLGEPFTVLHIHGSALCADYSTGAAVFLFFILVGLINKFNRKFLKRFYLQPSELITIYIMMIVACAIPSWGFTMNLIGLLGGIFYYATETNEWSTLIHPHLPKHLFPKKFETIWYLFEGIPKNKPIPWSDWIKPLSNWFFFIITFYILSICLMVFLRKQWVEKERISYPLTELPQSLVDEKRDILKSKIFWVGFFIPFFINGLKGLNKLNPIFPPVITSKTIPIFNNTFSLRLVLWFEVVGLAYFMATDVLLSVWLFAFLFSIETGFLNRIGFSIGPVLPFSDPAPQVVAFQSFGALIVLGISSLFLARDHLKYIFLCAIGKAKEKEEEILPYSFSFWLFIICVFWIYKTGLKFIPSLFFIIIAIFIFLGITRIIAQTGLAYYRAPIIPAVGVLYTFGSKNLASSGLTSLGMTFSWATDIRTLVMASTANGLKLATFFKINKIKLFWAILLSIIVTLISSAWCTLFLAYK